MNKKQAFKSIKKRLLCITIFFTLTVSVLTVTYCYFSYQTILYNSLSQSTRYSLQLLAETIQYDLNNALSLVYYCTSNDTVVAYLKASNAGQDNTRSLSYYAWQRLNEKYLSNSSSIYIDRIIISDLNDNYIQITPYGSYQNIPCAQVIREQPYFDALYHSSDVIQYGLVQDPITPLSQNNWILPIIRPIYSVYGKEPDGWCYIAISSNIFVNRLKSYKLPSDSRLYITIQGDSYHWQDGHLSASSLPPENNRSFSRFQESVSYQPAGANWYVTQTLSQAQLKEQASVYMHTLFLIIGIVVALGIVLTIYIHRSINVPLRKLMKKLSLVSAGDFSSDSSIEWNNELGEIGKGINAMGKDIVRLIQSRMEDQQKKYELEYEVLQNQVNPHFLYNTLNSISWMAAAQGARGIVEMAEALSMLLKSTSKKSGSTHTLREELELLDNYFLIQKYRYGGGISMEYQVEQDQFYDCMVLKFLLQIVVENSIFHGIEPKGSHGHILVSVKSINDNKDLSIGVTDDGIGMTQEQIDDVLNHSQGSSDLYRKIGISNIQKRLRYTYGDGYGISIESQPGSYTTVTITVPYIRKEAKNLV